VLMTFWHVPTAGNRRPPLVMSLWRSTARVTSRERPRSRRRLEKRPRSRWAMSHPYNHHHIDWSLCSTFQAKALAKASGDLSTSTAVIPETPAANLSVSNGADEDKKEKKSKKRRASEVDGGAEANGDKEKKKKKKSKD
jgi:hypothetical protein